MSFEYILPAHFIECFGEMLLEHNNKVINTHHASFSYCREMEGLLGTSGGTQTKDNEGYSP